MQTFLPYRNIRLSVRALDSRRLGKQRVEAKQILNCLSPDYQSKGWKNHPAVKMWVGHEEMLKAYHNECIYEWINRGYKNNMKHIPINYIDLVPPKWWGGEIHASHRANLLRKDPEHYGQFSWKEDPAMPYYWPTHHEKSYAM